MKTKFKLTRGGIQYFDAGGTVLPQTTVQSGNITGGLNQGNPFGTTNNPGPFGNTIANGITNTVSNGLQGAGTAAQGIASAFTAQNPYQAQLAPTQLTDYTGAISTGANNAAAGYGQFNQNLGNENNLAGLLTAEGQGYGPNPALAQLQQTTGQNIASQAALQASQRGASSNPGLLARQIAQQGGALNQQAVGQAATQTAQQDLSAQQAAAGLQGTIGSQITGEQNANTGLFTGASGAQNTQNTGQIQNYNNAQQINSQAAQSNANAVNKNLGGLLSGAGSALSLFAEGGEVSNPKLVQVPMSDRLNNAFYPQHIKAMAEIYHPKKMACGGEVKSLESGGAVPGKAKVKGDSYKNDVVSAKVSPGEIVLPRSVTQSDDPVGNAAEFVAGILQNHGSENDEDDFQGSLKKAISQRGKK